jgi:hypothetical protein
LDVTSEREPRARDFGVSDNALDAETRLQLFELQRSTQPVEQLPDGYLLLSHRFF